MSFKCSKRVIKHFTAKDVKKFLLFATTDVMRNRTHEFPVAQAISTIIRFNSTF